MTQTASEFGVQSADAVTPQVQRLIERLDRLQADQELVLELALRHYEGRAWNQFSTALAEYGYAVLRVWIARGQIFRRVTEKGRPIRRKISRIDGDAAKELAIETVTKAIIQFRERVLVPGVWNPGRGASLRTFFIGQCVLQFPDVYRAWEREQCIPPEGLDVGTAVQVRAFVAPVESQLQLREWMQKVDPRSVEMILAAVEVGLSHAEIAQRLNTTVRGVESRIHRLHKQRTLTNEEKR